MNNPKQLDFIRSLHVIFGDEFGQQSAEYMATYDIILRHVRNSSIYIGGLLLIGTLDHLQIQPGKNQRPFFTSNSIISCYKMISLKQSVRSTGDLYLEVQSLVRKDYVTFDSQPHLIQRFRHICSDIFTFVDTWNDIRITPTTFRLYSKKLPTREALKDYQNRIRREYEDRPNELRIRKSIDIEKSRYAHEWTRANDETSLDRDTKCKESSLLLFSVGAIFLMYI